MTLPEQSESLERGSMPVKVCVLTIAGSDSGGGAGIQSDIKTFRNHGVFGTTVITSITAQNTKGVQSAYEIPARIISEQLSSVLRDFRLRAVKTGMLSGPKVIDEIVRYLRPKKIKLIVDPVIFSKNSYRLLSASGIKRMRERLFPITYLITPNIPEAEILTGIRIDSIEHLESSAVVLSEMGVKNVLIKGGHLKGSIGLPLGTDVLFDGKKFYLFSTNYVKTSNTHGIGCTLSAAITANLASGKSLVNSIESAKQYVVKALKKTEKIGKGYSPVEQ
jgi:hydroxymethylpyrimidine/phosphomethylpyrimidine kinase